ncbi:peptidase U62 modulator of DNA gyrase, partial [mine drainage metagenome]
MTPEPSAAPIATRLAERIRTDAPWEVFAERLRRYEVHFNGPVVEVVRGPLVVEGFGVRLFRTRGDQTGAGFQASTDLSDAGLNEAVGTAERVAAHAAFPAKSVVLPATAGPMSSDPKLVDAALWSNPLPRLEEYVAALLDPFERIPNVVPSFGSVRATLAETSIANSAGLRAHYRHTTATLEIAVKAFGGPEGAAPGEYWVNDRVRRLDPDEAGKPVPDWARWAQDVRRAKPPASGALPVILPADLLSGILPAVIGLRCSGEARMRQIAPEAGTTVAAPTVTIADDATLPWAPNSSPFD